MAFSMFQAAIPPCVQILGSMSTVADKAAAHCAEKKYDEAWMLNDRLFPDMFTLARQFRQVISRGVWLGVRCRTSRRRTPQRSLR